MVRPEDNRDRRRLVELKAVDSAYPLYGRVETSSAEPLHSLLEQRDGEWGAIADPNLFHRLGLEPGDKIRLGVGNAARWRGAADAPRFRHQFRGVDRVEPT